MKVLWITNTVFPAVCEKLHLPLSYGGGWMYSSARALMKTAEDIELAVATLYGGRHLQKHLIGGVTYYLLPMMKGDGGRYERRLEPLWKEVKEDFRPDIVHLHGTEYTRGLAYLRACGGSHFVVSIQGLTGAYTYYYYYGLSDREILRNITLRDILRQDNIWQAKRKFHDRGIYENEILRRAGHIIGRTSWDRDRTWAINPKAEYHFCNETLRASFYRHIWKYSECEAHTIFVSQAGYPVKGLHQVLKAMPYILRYFPDTKVYVAGVDILDASTLKLRLKRSGYARILQKRIRKSGLQNHLFFTGSLSEEQMCRRYLRSNVFVCPSTIENSPNSLGEAQLLGMPCISSYVGGVPDMMAGQEHWLYRFEEVEMLAARVCEIFAMGAAWDGSELRQPALRRHDGAANAKALCDIYKSISRN